MSSRTTNVSATRRTIRGLRAAERVSDVESAFVQLAITSAKLLDDALAEGTERAYGVAMLVRVHRESIAALLANATAYTPDGMDAFLHSLTIPTPGTGSEWGDGATPFG